MIEGTIVDAHVHVWDTARLKYAWLADIPLLNKPYLPADYRRDCGPVRVEKIVFVQAEADYSQFLEEATWVSSLYREDRRIQGIVAWAPLERGEAARSAVEQLAAIPRVKGIRRILQSDALQFCLRPDFISGVRLLADYDLSFDLTVNRFQLGNAIQLVRQCPNVRFILDHIGNPDIAHHQFEPWRSQLRTLSGLPNVWCKMSGLVSVADREHWTREDLRPYIDHVLDCFGFDRVLFGSDYPVCLLGSSIPRWVETVEWAVSGCSSVERRKLFHDNAIAFYRLF